MRSNSALTPQKYLSVDEQAHFEALCDRHSVKDLRNTTMLIFMLKTGLRPSEVCNVLWGDIDESSQTLFVRTLKGGPSRVIPLCQSMIDRIKSLGPFDNEDLIFGVGYQTLRIAWNEYRPVRKKLHSLRHTFAVNMYNKSGHNLSLVQQALGHTSIQTTAIYLQIHASMSEMRKSMGWDV